MSIKFKLKDTFLILYAIFTFSSVIDASLINLGFIPIVINLLCVMGLSVLFVMRKTYDLKKIGIVILILLVFSVSAIFTEKLNLIVFAFFIVSAEGVDFTKIVKTSLISLCVALSIIFMCSVTGLIPDYTYEHSGQIAHSYGFNYYSIFPYYIMYVFIMYLYLRAKNVKWVEIICVFVLNFAVYRVFTVRLSMLICIMFLVLYALMVKLRVLCLDSFKFRTAAKLLFPLLCVFAIVCVIKFDPLSSTWNAINGVLSNRLSLSQEAMNIYRIPLFGQYIEMHGAASILQGGYEGEYFYIDSGYIYSLLGYGLVFTLLVIAMYTYLACMSCYYRDKTFFVWLIAVAVFSLVNNTWVDIYYNPALLCFMTVFGRERIKRRRKLHVTFR